MKQTAATARLMDRAHRVVFMGNVEFSVFSKGGERRSVQGMEVGRNILVVRIKQGRYLIRSGRNFKRIIFHGLIHFLSAERPEARTGSGWQPHRVCGFLMPDRRSALTRFFKRNKIRGKGENSKQKTHSAMHAVKFIF